MILPLKGVKIGSRSPGGGGEQKVLDIAKVYDSPESHCTKQIYSISLVLKFNGGER